MLDIQFIRENSKVVKEKSKQKGVNVNVEELLELDQKRKKTIAQLEETRQERNEHANSLKKGKPDKAQIDIGRELKEKITSEEELLKPIENRFKELLAQIPNMPLDEVPVGKSENDNKVIETVGEKPKFNFEPKSHVEIGEEKDWIDKKRAVKVAGSRFVYLKGDLVRLEWAMNQFGVDRLSDEEWLKNIIKENNLNTSSKPFIPILPPAVAKTAVYESTARLDKEETTYKLAEDDLWLNASAEHTLAPMHGGEIMDQTELPMRYVGLTTAFRREAGSYGKDIEGIIRLHQFNKLEIESFTTAEQGATEHILLVMIQRRLMEELGLPYQVVQKCTADIGGPNASGWDIDTWMAGQNAYRETHTADYMTDYQARRTKTRYRSEKGEVKLVHNNDATVFSERPLIAIIENFQTEEGDVKVPEVLQKYMGGRKKI